MKRFIREIRENIVPRNVLAIQYTLRSNIKGKKTPKVKMSIPWSSDMTGFQTMKLPS